MFIIVEFNTPKDLKYDYKISLKLHDYFSNDLNKTIEKAKQLCFENFKNIDKKEIEYTPPRLMEEYNQDSYRYKFYVIRNREENIKDYIKTDYTNILYSCVYAEFGEANDIDETIMTLTEFIENSYNEDNNEDNNNVDYFYDIIKENDKNTFTMTNILNYFISTNMTSFMKETHLEELINEIKKYDKDFSLEKKIDKTNKEYFTHLDWLFYHQCEIDHLTPVYSVVKMKEIE